MNDHHVMSGVRALVAIGLVGLLLIAAGSYYNDDPVRLTVTGKESVNTNDGHEYRIYADDEVYVMEDSIAKGRFRTANDYAKIEVGKTYSCTKFGARVPIFSMFENLRDCHQVAR